MENHEGVSKNTIWKIKKDKVRIQFGRLRRSKVRIQFGRSRSKVRIQLQIRVEQKIYILLLALLNIQEVELNSFQTVYILFRISSIHPSKSQPITAQSSTSQHFPAHPSTIYSTSQHITAHTIADPSTSQQIPWHIPAHPSSSQHIPAHPSTFQHILAHPSTSQHIQAHLSTSQHIPVHPSSSQHIPAYPSTSQHIPTHPSTSQHIPAHLSTSQHIPTHPLLKRFHFALQPLYRKNTTFYIILICSSWSGLQYGPSNLWDNIIRFWPGINRLILVRKSYKVNLF